MSKEKKHKLDLHTSHVKNTLKDLGKFTVLSDGKNGDVKNDIGGAIKRYMERLPQSKTCKRFYRRVTEKNMFAPNQPLR